MLQHKLSKCTFKFLQDMFTTLVEMRWRWTLSCFVLTFFLSWTIFALIWWLIAYAHGDLDEDHLPPEQENSHWIPCVSKVYGFTSCYLFSVETQHTTGYGDRTPSEECPEAIFLMSMQNIVGLIIEAFMIGTIFAKMTRPKLRTQTLLFSKNAVISQRDGYLCLMFRVGDLRKSHIVDASIRAQLIRSRKTKEGELLHNYQTQLTVSADGCDSNLFFIWPMIIVHKIDENSPFYNLAANDLLQEKFEVVVIWEGTVESTGLTTQARSSYLNSEILWGHRYESIVVFNKIEQKYEVQYSRFDQTYSVDTPLCSGAELYALQNSTGKSFSNMFRIYIKFETIFLECEEKKIGDEENLN